jgi:hypothetical protein
MQIHWQEEALALTPETEQDRALLNALAAAHRPTNRTRTPPPLDAVQSGVMATGVEPAPRSES